MTRWLASSSLDDERAPWAYTASVVIFSALFCGIALAAVGPHPLLPRIVQLWVPARRAQWLRGRGVEHTAALDRDLLAELRPQRSALADALQALAAAVHAARRRSVLPACRSGRCSSCSPAGD